LNNVIKKLRKEKNLTQLKLAEKSGVSRTTINEIENCKVEPTGKTIIKIANALDTPVQQIFFDMNVVCKQHGE
jgi:putative transcriptional regulator